MRRILWSFWNSRVRPGLDALPPHVKADPGLGWLSTQWAARFNDVPPIGHQIRGGERWVRFHSLPESKRYAEDESEYRELLHRQHAVLATLTHPGSSLIVVTTSWSPTRHPRNRPRFLRHAAPHASLWKSLVGGHPEDTDPWYVHLFVSEIESSSPALDALLRLVADFQTTDVVLTTRDLDWLFIPYDGGVDVIAPSAAERDLLAGQFAHWLPTNDSGL